MSESGNFSSLSDKIESKKISIINLVSAIIAWIITAIWMIEIFNLSSETGDASTFRSQELLMWLQDKFGIDYIGEALIRDFAHVIEFAVLALVTYVALFFSNRIVKTDGPIEYRMIHIKSENEMCILCSLWICELFAILDEYHQLFVIGRSGSIVDAAIDSIGIITVLLIIRIAFTIRMIRIKKYTF